MVGRAGENRAGMRGVWGLGLHWEAEAVTSSAQVGRGRSTGGVGAECGRWTL